MIVSRRKPLTLPPGGSVSGLRRETILTEEECGQKCSIWYAETGVTIRYASASLHWFRKLGYLPNSSSVPLRGPPSPREKGCASRINDHLPFHKNQAAPFGTA